MQRLSATAEEIARLRAKDSADPQREVVYAFEASWSAWGNNDLTLEQCRDAVRWACRAYDVPMPQVTQHHTEAMSECDVALGRISFQAKARRAGRGGKNAPVALHEAAHWIVWQKHGDKPQDHGPVFMGVYMALLIGYNVAPASALRASAREWKLRWRKNS